jgi:hypothetical protein
MGILFSSCDKVWFITNYFTTHYLLKNGSPTGPPSVLYVFDLTLIEKSGRHRSCPRTNNYCWMKVSTNTLMLKCEGNIVLPRQWAISIDEEIIVYGILIMGKRYKLRCRWGGGSLRSAEYGWRVSALVQYRTLYYNFYIWII